MMKVFSKIALAITLSPTCEPLLAEANRIKNAFDSELILIHVGEKNTEKEVQFKKYIECAGLPLDTELIWEQGEPAKTIIAVSEREKCDLIIGGALKKENILDKYIGSIARKIIRKSKCSVLIFTDPSLTAQKFDKIYTAVEFTPNGEKAVVVGDKIATLLQHENAHYLRECYLPAVSMSIWNSGSNLESTQIKNELFDEEKEKVSLFLGDIGIERTNSEITIIYGKEGMEITNFITETKPDLYILPAPAAKFSIFERLFPHNIELLLESLPCNILLVRSGI